MLVFRRVHKPASFKENKGDAESGGTPVTGRMSKAANGNSSDGNSSDKATGILQAQTSVFHWNNVCYEVRVKGETRQILNNADGWVKPGTLTALMGVSGADKTTLLDCLVDRTSMGVITREMLVGGHPRDTSFQRKTGYVHR